METRAVLFDWRGTLVVPPSFEHLIRDGLDRCGSDIHFDIRPAFGELGVTHG
jgi:hypothetical protein